MLWLLPAFAFAVGLFFAVPEIKLRHDKYTQSLMEEFYYPRMNLSATRTIPLAPTPVTPDIIFDAQRLTTHVLLPVLLLLLLLGAISLVTCHRHPAWQMLDIEAPMARFLSSVARWKRNIVGTGRQFLSLAKQSVHELTVTPCVKLARWLSNHHRDIRDKFIQGLWSAASGFCGLLRLLVRFSSTLFWTLLVSFWRLLKGLWFVFAFLAIGMMILCWLVLVSLWHLVRLLWVRWKDCGFLVLGTLWCWQAQLFWFLFGTVMFRTFVLGALVWVVRLVWDFYRQIPRPEFAELAPQHSQPSPFEALYQEVAAANQSLRDQLRQLEARLATLQRSFNGLTGEKMQLERHLKERRDALIHQHLPPHAARSARRTEAPVGTRAPPIQLQSLMDPAEVSRWKKEALASRPKLHAADEQLGELEFWKQEALILRSQIQKTVESSQRAAARARDVKDHNRRKRRADKAKLRARKTSSIIAVSTSTIWQSQDDVDATMPDVQPLPAVAGVPDSTMPDARPLPVVVPDSPMPVSEPLPVAVAGFPDSPMSDAELPVVAAVPDATMPDAQLLPVVSGVADLTMPDVSRLSITDDSDFAMAELSEGRTPSTPKERTLPWLTPFRDDDTPTPSPPPRSTIQDVNPSLDTSREETNSADTYDPFPDDSFEEMMAEALAEALASEEPASTTATATAPDPDSRTCDNDPVESSPFDVTTADHDTENASLESPSHGLAQSPTTRGRSSTLEGRSEDDWDTRFAQDGSFDEEKFYFSLIVQPTEDIVIESLQNPTAGIGLVKGSIVNGLCTKVTDAGQSALNRQPIGQDAVLKAAVKGAMVEEYPGVDSNADFPAKDGYHHAQRVVNAALRCLVAFMRETPPKATKDDLYAIRSAIAVPLLAYMGLNNLEVPAEESDEDE
ncbi:MAG: hypothetical protein M1818_002906 [Claussenomyces sp. TS43310]|nr:MAG: hypothetical protein M1818_002906 [Claussenomyces sp. TS43310]